MEARFQAGRFPTRAFVIGMAITLLALLSAFGGYSIRLLTAPVPASVVTAAQGRASHPANTGDRWYLDSNSAPASVHEDNGR